MKYDRLTQYIEIFQPGYSAGTWFFDKEHSGTVHHYRSGSRNRRTSLHFRNRNLASKLPDQAHKLD